VAESVLAACLLALLSGVVAGLRTMTAPTAVSWAAHLGRLDLRGTWLASLGYSWTPWIISVLALMEFVTDQLPSTPSRTVPMQFGARIVSGALAGAAIGASGGASIAGLLAGIVGAIIGTLGGRAWPRAAGRSDRERSSRRLHRGRGRDRRCAADCGRTTMSRFDANIIGAGQAGSPLAGRLTRAGTTVAIVDETCSVGPASTPAACRPRRSSPGSAQANS
jgi:uncharacterized membrane protein